MRQKRHPPARLRFLASLQGAWIYNERNKGMSIAATDEGHRKNNSIEGEDEGQGKRGKREGAGSAAETRGVEMAHRKGNVTGNSGEDKGRGEEKSRRWGRVKRAPGATPAPRFKRRLSREIHRQRDLLRNLSL